MSSIPFYVGCYTRVEGHVPNGCGEGIYAYNLDLETGAISRQSVVSGMTNPSYVYFDKDAKAVYAVEEIGDAPADLIAYAINADGSLTETSRQSTQGLATCHINKHGKHVLAASYVSGSAASFEFSDGQLAAGSSASYEGTGPNTDRQEASHGHQVAVSPDGKWIYVCDLGADKLWCHSTDLPLTAHVSATSTPAGSGPRHMVFHPTKPVAYVISELTGTLLTYAYNSDTGELTLTAETNSLPADYTEEPSSAGIRMHPSGNAVYVANRGHNSIGIFPVDADGAVQDGNWIPCGGDTPRDFAIDPTGKWLVVGNQDDSTITVFEIADSATVDAASMQTFPCNTPTAIAFPE